MTNYKSIEKMVKDKSPDTVLVAVSKTKPIESIMEAYEEGARIFGENRVQEIVAKFSQEKKRDMKVYLIGQLQSNKVKKAVLYADRIESVDSIPLLEKINTEAGKINKKMEILLEVNSSFEEQKSGFRTREEVIEAASLASKLENINLVGLMTVGPLGSDDDKNRKAFLYTKEIFDEISKTHPLSVLSMGMSGDWESAIECGSTEVRIGTAIFGGRS
ncbi:MAG: YggS family pyridoxal phosphate-dependent enzyme [Spirochaetales bacterium]|nr:YggS family pyridoxal phosphate-dependent enzyme [Spirochaetales bacterium]